MEIWRGDFATGKGGMKLISRVQILSQQNSVNKSLSSYALEDATKAEHKGDLPEDLKVLRHPIKGREREREK